MTVEIVTEKFMLDECELYVELTADHRGLTACRLLPTATPRIVGTANKFLLEATITLEAYFQKNSTDLPAHLAPDGTPFQQRVWQATCEIPYGEVRSYTWVARRAGSPKAVRAVAQALAANPLLLFVPCHRVVRTNGDLGGFACGLEWKERLLAHEGVVDPRMLDLAAT